jgi:hypothetical protein
MRSTLVIASFFMAIVGSSPRANAQVAPAGKTQSVQRAIDDVWARVIAADKQGDAAALAANYTEDANIEEFYRSLLATTKLLDVRRTRTSLEVSGNLAVENGTYTHRVQQGTNPPIESTDRYTVVFRNVNGRWLVSRDIATPMPEAK